MGVQSRVIRFRWTGTTAEDPATLVGWALPSIILATLFLNFPFWFSLEPDIMWLGPPCVRLGLIAGIGLFFVFLFYLGPALLGQSRNLSLFRLAEYSFGTIPGIAFRICCVLYLTIWLTFYLQTIGILLVPWPLSRNITGTESVLILAALAVFLLATALQTLHANAKLALFTNKLCLAIFLAALIRVRAGLPAVAHALFQSPGSMETVDWRRIPFLVFYLAPLALFASNFGHRAKTRKDTALIGLVGLATAFAFSLLAAGVVAHAASAAHFRVGIGSAVSAALFGGASARYIPPRMMVTAITAFGAARFGFKALANAVRFESQSGRRIVLALLGCLVVVLNFTNSDALYSLREFLTRCLVVAAAVLSANSIAPLPGEDVPKKLAWIGGVSLLAGMATQFLCWYFFENQTLEQDELWWYPWLLPSYFAGLGTGLLLRLSRRLWLSRRRLALQ